VTRYVAFLRAINVGGRTVKMDPLRRTFESIGFSRVETFIASGNVVFETRGRDTTTMEATVQHQLRESLGYDVATFIRSVAQVGEVAGYLPFAAAELEVPGSSLYVSFLGAIPSLEAHQKLLTFRGAEDDFHVHGREVYRLCRKKVSESAFTGAQFERVIGMPATARNITTIRKLAAKYCPE
jgi:uncharacterized protein (DUF1697 family)